MPEKILNEAIRSNILSKLKGSSHLLTGDHFEGLARLFKVQSSRVTTNCIKQVEQVQSSGGQLKCIRLSLDKDEGPWFPRALTSMPAAVMSSEQPNNSSDGEYYYVDLDPFLLATCQFGDIRKNFSWKSPEVTLEHYENLEKFMDLMPHPNGYKIEERFLHFDHETKVASGPLTSLMVKMQLWPNSIRSTLKTMADFNDQVIASK